MNYILGYLNIGKPETMLLAFTFFSYLVLAVTLYCLVDITRSTFKDSANKYLWVLITLIFPGAGALVYLVFGRKQKARALRI